MHFPVGLTIKRTVLKETERQVHHSPCSCSLCRRFSALREKISTSHSNTDYTGRNRVSDRAISSKFIV